MRHGIDLLIVDFILFYFIAQMSILCFQRCKRVIHILMAVECEEKTGS